MGACFSAPSAKKMTSASSHTATRPQRDSNQPATNSNAAAHKSPGTPHIFSSGERRKKLFQMILPRHGLLKSMSPVGFGGSSSGFSANTPVTPNAKPHNPDACDDDSTLDGRIFSWLPQIHWKDSHLQNKLPIVKRFMIDEHENQSASDVGRLTKEDYFNDYEGFVCNVTSGVGSTNTDEAAYSDPTSIWFNTSLGFYEIIVSDDEWDRPFGYEKDGVTLRLQDILRLLVADWNLFTAYMYGVPKKYCDQYLPEKTNILKGLQDDHVKNEFIRVAPERTLIDDKYFDEIQLTKVPCVSTYQSRRNDAAKLEPNSGLTALWQEALGLPPLQEIPDFPESFIEAKMSGTCWVTWKKKKDGYHTIIVSGAFVNDSLQERGIISREELQEFTDIQLAGSKQMLDVHYSDLGFNENFDHATQIESIKIDEKEK